MKKSIAFAIISWIIAAAAWWVYDAAYEPADKLDAAAFRYSHSIDSEIRAVKQSVIDQDQ